jgi:hypothetical protein
MNGLRPGRSIIFSAPLDCHASKIEKESHPGGLRPGHRAFFPVCYVCQVVEGSEVLFDVRYGLVGKKVWLFQW